MKLLILLIAMGVIGVIGTVEYSHAETILTLNPLPNTPEPKDQAIALQHDNANITRRALFELWHFTVNPNLTKSVIHDMGTVFIPGPYLNITSNPSLPKQTNILQYCIGNFHPVHEILRNPAYNITNLVIPNNIIEKNNKTIIAMGFNLYQPQHGNAYPCNLNIYPESKHPLIVDKELIFTLYNQSDKKAYYFSPRENIMEAQPIPLCTTETIDTTKLTLKGETKMCYGKHNDNMVIVTKKLTGFYGATTTITTPTKQYALDSDRNDTLDYLNLLKKLYLPAI